MKALQSLVIKAEAAVSWAESPKVQHVWRCARIAAAYVASTGVVDQVAHGTATRAGVAAVATGLLEVLYRKAKPAA